MLQRGLGIDAEDGIFQTDLVFFGGQASTGPRHRCRGRRAKAAADAFGGTLLQRGLGIDAEDGYRARAPSSGRTCFNGASASMPRTADAGGDFATVSSVLQRGLGIDAEDGGLSWLAAAIDVQLQ